MMIIDHSIDWLLSSMVPSGFSPTLMFVLFAFSLLFLSFSPSLSLFFSPENDMEVQTGRRGHLQNERET